MKRIVEFEVAGKSYPLNFSVKVARQIDEEFGGLENFDRIMDCGVGKALTALCALLHSMMADGATYLRLTEGRDIEVPTLDELETLLGFSDIGSMKEAVTRAAGIGSAATVEVEVSEKNAETAQSA